MANSKKQLLRINNNKKILGLLKKINRIPLIFSQTNFKKFHSLGVNISNSNTNKKLKIVYVGHSHHLKTKSTQFLKDYLSEFFDLIDVADESWQGQEYPDLKFIDHSYFAVIFFQSTPPKNVEKKIKCKNKIFIPMYDGYGGQGAKFWSQFKHYKIINFSKKLHEEVSALGLNSLYIQYFPEPKEFSKGEANTVFFWQRHTHININTIIKLFESTKSKVKIHIHTKVDPMQSYVEPTEDQIQKYSITESDWFENKEDVHKLISSKQIFIAPREYEGIGQSFLEAMAMGKVVIASDRPTMNEYIVDGKTGFLFDLHNIRSLNLKNLDEIQLNTYNYMLEGYNSWLKNRQSIIDFINYK